MSADQSTIRYICPFCDDDFGTLRKAKRHITETESGKHHNVNGFDMDKTIEIKNKETDLPMHEKIKRAADRVNTLDYTSAERVADKAGVSKYRVLRVWSEAGKSIEGLRSNTTTSWGTASDNCKDVLAYKFLNPDSTASEFVAEMPDSCGQQTYYETIKKYGFILEKRYRPDNFKETSKKRMKATDHKDVQEESENSVSNDTPSTEEAEKRNSIDRKLVEALDDSGVGYEVSIEVEEQKFEVIKKLIKNGHDDVAEQYYKE